LEEIENNPGSVSAIQSGETNGGVLGYIDEEYCKAKKYHIVQGPFLSVARSGTSGYVAYHPGKCVIGDSVKALVLKEKSTENVYLFLQTVLQQNRYKYSYGRKVTLDNYSSLVIKLPVLKDHEGNVIIDRKKKFPKNGYIPDWGYMESYVNSIILRERESGQALSKALQTSVGQPQTIAVNETNWRNFEIGELFSIKKGSRLTKEDMTQGTTNYLGAIDNNNGVREKIGESPKFMGNCISINYNGSVGEAFYQPAPFWASDDVDVLFPKGWDLNPYIGMFICTVIKANKYRFCYGRKWTVEKMKKSTLKLPANPEGKIDLTFMEHFVRSLPYSDKIELLS
jgi:restriction endonuclease S subunit